MKDRPRILYVDTGPLPVHVGFTSNPRLYALEMKRLGIEEPPSFTTRGKPATTHTFTKGGRELCCIVCIDVRQARERGITVVQVLSLAVHEIVHCWQNVIEEIGEVKPSAELEAYNIQCWCQQVMSELLGPMANRRFR